MSKIGADPQDRPLGEYWEDIFCELARGYGWEAWPFQRKRGATFTDDMGHQYICPDVWILRRGSKQYACEIKHKTVSRRGYYGFEEYRVMSLLNLQHNYENKFGPITSLYIVHNWDRAGGKYIQISNVKDWDAQRLDMLEKHAISGREQTLYNGLVTRRKVPIHYYPFKYFVNIEEFLR